MYVDVKSVGVPNFLEQTYILQKIHLPHVDAIIKCYRSEEKLNSN